MNISTGNLLKLRCTGALALCLALLFCAGLCTSPALAQISSGGTPPSFSSSISGTVPTIQMPAVDTQSLMREDSVVDGPHPFRFAAELDVAYNLRNSGVWTTLPNGDHVWRLRISSPGAYSIGLLYNDWFIPKGGQLYLYNDNRSKVIGAFTSANNWDGPNNITEHIPGDAITLEYLEPAALSGQSRLSVSKVCHAYRDVLRARATDSFGDSEPCEININCPAGASWQAHKHGVAMYFINNSGQCSGTLVNNTAQDYTPYFLTANHCTSNPSDTYIFYFNYESPNCSNINGPGNQTVANATLVSNYSISDFTLLRLSTPVPMAYSPYWAGWDRSGGTPANCTGISHPRGDIKKIYWTTNAMFSSDWNGVGPNSHWGMWWTSGAMEPGSSGSPGYDQNGRVIGQLHGGYPGCSNPNGPLALYGKLSVSWPGNGSNSTRLSNWLDPSGSNPSVVNGAYPSASGNDACPGYGIYSLPYTDNGNTNLAVNNYTHAIFGTSPDVVYNLQLTCATAVTASLCGSAFDTGIEIRTGDACPGTTLVASNDDYCGNVNGNPYNSLATFTAQPGVQYFILVYGYGSNSGAFTLSVTGTPSDPVPANDACPGTLISALPYSNTGSTCTATANYSNCVTTSSPEVVYTVNVPSCQTVTASLCGSNYDTQISVYAGGSCPGNTLVACNDDYCGLQSQVSFLAQGNTNYYVLIGGYFGLTGNYTLNVTGTPFTPPNDVCPGTTIASLPYSDAGNTACGTHDYAVACRVTSSPDVVYNFTPASCESLTVSLCGSTYDCVLDVRAGGACPGQVSVACNDDNYCGATFGLQSTVTFRAYAGVTYYFIVSGFNGAAGAFVLNASAGGAFTPSNDVCPGTAIASLPFTDIGSTACDNHNYQNFQGNTSPDAVYTLNSATCQSVTVSLCGSGYDTGISVYRNGACPGTTLVVGNDDNLCGGNSTLQSTVNFQASANVTYYLIVHGYSSNAGPYVLNVTGQPCSTPASVDSLVILPMAPHMYLQWASQGPAYYYNIYRWTSPTGLVSSVHKIDSTLSLGYYDVNVLSTAADRYYYAVTAAQLPTLVEGESGSVSPVVDKATAAPTSEPWFAADPFAGTESAPDAPKLDAARQEPVFINAYSRLNTVYVPNPNKQAPNPVR
ncbi:MAG TPA: serine protease [bacterium]|jgi:hypothetical protein